MKDRQGFRLNGGKRLSSYYIALKIMKKILPLLLLAFICGCEDTSKPRIYDYNTAKSPIINGTKVTGNNYLSTIAFVRPGYYTSYEAFCTGTLVSPDTVVTAAHCIANCEPTDDTESLRPKMKVAIGQSEGNWTKMYSIKSFHPHPDFVCTDYEIKNDIAVVRLKNEVPKSVAIPTSIIPVSEKVTIDEIDGWFSNLTGTTVGFGMTDGYDNYSSGTKYWMTADIIAYCPLTGTQSSNCEYYDFTRGFIYIDGSSTNVCSGDSGGPTFIKRNGVQYLAAVTSFGDEYCETYAGLTAVQDYRSFIKQHANNLAADDLENCYNNKDDNGDGKIDCDDLYCWHLGECQGEEHCSNEKDDDGDNKVDCDDPDCEDSKLCLPEDCFNEIDDNENGKLDCEEASCASLPQCAPEDCTNKIDDNGNGKTDCEDTQCRKVLQCQPEDCENKVDDNGNGLVDCEDAGCSHLLKCIPEDCTNRIDDNGNGLVDCDDTQCFGKLICEPEHCTNNADDNGDGLADCKDPSCFDQPHCQIEDCTNKVDDNRNGLIDCQDPGCMSQVLCKPEICNDNVDNNGNSLIDCQEPSCMTQTVCQPENCANGVDDNGNGLIDCQEPSCMTQLNCQPEQCSNAIDDNGNGLIDCQDPGCTETCAAAGSDSSCSAISRSQMPMPTGGWLLVLMSALGFGVLRRRRSC